MLESLDTLIADLGGFVVITVATLIALLALALIGLAYVSTQSRRKMYQYSSTINGDLEESRNRLAAAEKIGHFGSFIWDFQTNQHFWSDEMYALHATDKRMHRTAPTLEEFYAMILPEDRERAKAEMVKAMKTSGEFEVNYRIELPTRAIRSLTLKGKILTVPGDRVHLVHSIQGTVHDVTREKEIDRAKTEFVSLASHQLKTPLTSINWYAEMLLDGDVGALNADQKKYIQEMYDSNQRMVDLVNSLLNVSRIELGTFSVEPVPTDIVEMARSVINEQMPTITQRKQKLTTHFGDNIPMIPADTKLLRMVLQNLLSNAIKYTPEGGAVEFEVVLGLRKNTIAIRVTDTGCGIPENQKDRIFSKLFRADNVRSQNVDGTGLGLYIVKSIIEHSHGTVSFISEEGKGTSFFVTLPLDGMEKKDGARKLA
ncbi:MAG: ATP-binding protein [Minisyncoccia bacterium]